MKPTLSITINDCDVQTFRAGGKGGQNQNKRDTGLHCSPTVMYTPLVSKLQNARYTLDRLIGDEEDA